MFKNIEKVSVKLIISFIIVSVISSIPGILGIFILKATDKNYSDALINNGFVQGDIGQFNTDLNQGGAVVRDIILQTDSSSISDSQKGLASIAGHLNDSLAKVKEGCQTPEEIAIIERMEASMEEYRILRDQVVEFGVRNEDEQALTLFYQQAYPKLSEAVNAAQELADLNIKMGNEVSTHLTSQANTTTLIIAIVLAVSFATSIVFAIFISRSISTPVIAVQKATEQLEQGDLNIHVSSEQKDEIGVMTNAFASSVAQIRAYILDITRGLGEVAKGNFTIRPQEEFKGDFKAIEDSIEIIIESLSSTLGDINQAADQVSCGSDQVSAGAQALSQGSTEQASSVEELAATINEISQQVKIAAQNAQEASGKVNSVGNEIDSSSEQMKQLILAMGDISQKSSEIEKIIKTIDDIAFQTNILSLNAAVEAARAGEAGKGFAVVADEVRNLASKSAEAAEHTTELIGSSSVAVKNGTKIASETHESLMRVVEGTHEVVLTVNKISEAAHEQANSIAQVTIGVDQISSVVQTNSATAEESAAASEELSGQAQMLKTLVEKFQLKDDSHSEGTNVGMGARIGDEVGIEATGLSVNTAECKY